MTALVEQSAEETRLDAIQAQLDGLTTQIETLSSQLALLTDEALETRRRRREWDELKADLTPIVRDVYDVTTQQLEEIQAYVQLEDVLHLLKRLARNTHSMNDLLDQIESLQDFWRDFSPLTQDMFAQAVTTLEMLEQKGYFGFVRQTQYVADQIVGSFNEEDVRLLGDNIVTILTTIRALTQPEIMNLVSNLTQSYHQADVEPIPTSMMGLLGQMRDPQVRRGLAITMNMLKHVSQQTPSAGTQIHQN